MAYETQETLHSDTETAEAEGTKDSGAKTAPALVILHHPDPDRVGEVAVLPQLMQGETVWLSRLEPGFVAPGAEARSLADSHLSRRPMLLTPGPTPGSVAIEVAGSPTRIEVGGVRLAPSLILTAAEVEQGVLVELGRRIVLLLCRRPLEQETGPDLGLVGQSPAMVRLRAEIQVAAELPVPTLLRGETGTGKELVARALHDQGPRRNGPFVAVNLGALPATLAASELFGAARGAYTGADRQRSGLFLSADGGTLFLDEIGEAPAEVQVMLLRVLEEGEIQPVGSVERRRVDVRVVAATDADLERASEVGSFRAPLLHRLAGYEIRLPPLRERADDVARLWVHFLRQELADPPWQRADPWPSTALVARLVRARWQGNVRQLRNVTRRLATAHRLGSLLPPLIDELLGPAPAPGGSLAASTQAADPSSGVVTPSKSLTETAVAVPRRWLRRPSEVDDEELLGALADHRWQLRPTARALGVSRATLYRLIDACPEIRKAVDLTADEIVAALDGARGDHRAAALELRVSPQGLKRRITALGLDD